MCYLVVVRTGVCDSYRLSVPTATVLASFATVVAEPATTNFALGQVNIILCWAVVEDVLGRRRWFTGALVGVAAGIKLVPAIFIVYFLLTRRWRAAAVSAGVAAATVIVGALVMPRSSRLYWSGLGELQNRVAGDPLRGDGVDQVGNQSVLGALHRLTGEDMRVVWVLIGAVILIIAGVRVWSVRGPGQAVESLVVLALAGLLVSPVSWTPHWIWITPLVIVLLVRAKDDPERVGMAGCRAGRGMGVHRRHSAGVAWRRNRRGSRDCKVLPDARGQLVRPPRRALTGVPVLADGEIHDRLAATARRPRRDLTTDRFDPGWPDASPRRPTVRARKGSRQSTR